jgi:arabinan endo-1,5-alpha-L-arabinosidase
LAAAAAFISLMPMPSVVARPIQEMLALEGDVGGTHDPVVIKQGGTYYVFVTGGRSGQGIIPIKTSTDMRV